MSSIFSEFCLVILYENSVNNDYSIDERELYGKNFINLIYKTFSDDLLNQFASNLEIEIRFINSDNSETINDLNHEFNDILYVFLIDLFMVANKDYWINLLYDIKIQQEDNNILPIALTENFIYLKVFNDYQCLLLYKYINTCNILKLQIAQKILDLFIKKSSLNTTTNSSIFISYTQKDFGIDFAWKLTEWINSNTTLDTFLDFYDLPPGELFEDHITKNIEKDHNLFLAIKTDNYSTRTWCISEILNARKIEIPILVVDSIIFEEKRTFPYLSNCKTIKADIVMSDDNKSISEIKNIDYIISEAVMELLRVKINILRQIFIKNQALNDNIRMLNNQPDLFNLLYSFKSNEHRNSNIKTTFLYPDPPISIKEESEIKTLINKNIDLVPNSLSIMNIDTCNYSVKTILSNCELGISVATPCDINKYGFIERHLYSYLIELGRCFIYHNTTISYGGDIKYSEDMSFMKAFAIMTEYYRDDSEYKIVNYLTERTKSRISLKEKTKYENYVQFIEPKYYMDPSYKINSKIYLSKAQSNMRRHMNELLTGRIVIGGRITSQKAFSGVLEEFLLAMKSQKPIFLIGFFGGMTKIIGDLIFGNITPAELTEFDFIGNRKLKNLYEELENKVSDYHEILGKLHNANNCLNNGLNVIENKELFHCKNPRRAFQLIIKGMINYDKSEIS